MKHIMSPYQLGQGLDRLLLRLDLDTKSSKMDAKLIVRPLLIAVVAVDIYTDSQLSKVSIRGYAY